MKKLLLLVVVLVGLGIGSQLNAQAYSSALGLRFGYPLSLSYKTFVSNTDAVELFGGLRGYSSYRWLSIGGVYERHWDIAEVERLKWYAGAGASVFFWNYKNTFIGDRDVNTSVGILGTLGLDYAFEDAPVNISVDWMPIYFFNGFTSGFGGGFGALSVRYILK